jgi:hypothetical protein
MKGRVDNQRADATDHLLVALTSYQLEVLTLSKQNSHACKQTVHNKYDSQVKSIQNVNK